MKQLAFCVLALCAVVWGCAPTTEPAPEGDSTVTTSKEMPDNEVQSPSDETSDAKEPSEEAKQEATSKPAAPPKADTDMKPAAYRNAEGQLVCPVMNIPIESEEKAVGFQDYEGVRYYFCCGDCPKAFKKDPTRWIKTQN